MTIDVSPNIVILVITVAFIYVMARLLVAVMR